VLYAEGTDPKAPQPKMMSIGLHCRLVGRPGRLAALEKFFKYVSQHDKVWVCTRSEIAHHWRNEFPFEKSKK
jgi:peptidoglycan/xylan/chitin deacetylase (PgdA/CDA1 family)